MKWYPNCPGNYPIQEIDSCQMVLPGTRRNLYCYKYIASDPSMKKLVHLIDFHLYNMKNKQAIGGFNFGLSINKILSACKNEIDLKVERLNNSRNYCNTYYIPLH